MTRIILKSLALIATLPVTAMANIDTTPLERDVAILTPAKAEQIEIVVAGDEVDACRALLSAVLGSPPVGENAFMNAPAAPSLPVVQCVVEARAE